MILPFNADEKKNALQIHNEIETLSSSPIIEGLMSFVDGCIAVLNSKRQIVALNTYLLEELAIQDPAKVLGLRLGEAVACDHATEETGDCGSTDFCITCGAAIATMASLYEDREDEEDCIIKRENSSRPDIMLKIKTRPFYAGGEKFVLLFLRNITLEQRRAALERVFFHDISNVLSGLSGAVSLLEEGESNEKLFGIIRDSSNILCREVEIQRYLSEKSNPDFKLEKKAILIPDLFNECKTFCSYHPSISGRDLIFLESEKKLVFHSDFSICQRILNNMIINALEASGEGESVTVRGELKGSKLVFSVQNRQFIPEEIQLRIFQRNFSTKNKEGRGIGAFSMKILGEEILGGEIHFESSPDRGTTFYFSLPLNP